MDIEETLTLARAGLKDAQQIARDVWELEGPGVLFYRAAGQVQDWERTILELDRIARKKAE